MASRDRRAPRSGKRRTTLTLPSSSLELAERIARARKVNLSTVVSEFVEEGAKSRMAAARVEEVLTAYREAFSGFSDEEMLVLDGVMLSNDPEK
jgi:hypothetical protein